jgi:hypothetical protein
MKVIFQSGELMSQNIVIGSDNYIGAVKFNGNWRLFHQPLSMWILDYSSYDDEYAPKQGEWRENLMRVDESNAQDYIQYIAKNELLPDQIPYVVKGKFPGQALLTFVVNFDERLFVNGWHDNIAIDEYVPSSWTSIEDEPLDYVPSEISALWESELNS